jgi:hypothetical protein
MGAAATRERRMKTQGLVVVMREGVRQVLEAPEVPRGVKKAVVAVRGRGVVGVMVRGGVTWT